MTLHLIKLCVGCDDVETLAHLQRLRLQSEGRLYHITRQTPRRAAELLDGGSIYWVIRKAVRVRQRLIGLDGVVDADGVGRCRLLLDPKLVETRPWPHRAFQGWRYLTPERAPPDAAPADGDGAQLPLALAAELRALGLL